MKEILITILLLAITLNNYSQKNENKIHGRYYHGVKCKCPDNYNINEISKLRHIKNQFYRNEKGHLYIKTHSAGYPLENGKYEKDTEYFSSSISQEIDVQTFKPFDESLFFTYAKDKKNIYYCQSTSSGDHIWQIKNGDPKTLKILNTISGLFATDKNNIYHYQEILLKFKPNKTKFRRNKKGEVIEFIQGKLKYKIE